MARNINNSVNCEQESRDKGGEPVALIRSFLQRKNSANQQGQAHDCDRHGRPSHFTPKPKPIAFRMQGARVAKRGVTKNCKDWLEIYQTDSAPGRIPDQFKGIAKYPPPEIGRDTGVANVAKMKSLQGFPAENQKSGQQQQDKRESQRNSRGGPLPKSENAKPKRAARDED